MSTVAAPWGADPRLARLVVLADSEPDSWPTRDRILYEAARLMALRGYHGTTTRDIASAVGIQQPSIFNHFPSKYAIIEELFEYDQVLPAARAAALVREGGSPACQLYRYVAWQTRWYRDLPFDLRGVLEELIDELDVVRARKALQSWRRSLNRIVRAGIDADQFYVDGHDFLYSAINALAFEVVRIPSGAPPRGESGWMADSAASFVLRATLRDPSTLDDVRAEVSHLDRDASPFV